MQQYPILLSILLLLLLLSFDFDSGDDDSKLSLHFDAALGAIGGTGTVGTFGVFCCLFEERVVTGMRKLRKVEQIEYKEEKINF
jgi:hypothetical protein